MSAVRMLGVGIVAAGVIGLTLLSTAPPVVGQAQPPGYPNPGERDTLFQPFQATGAEGVFVNVWQSQGNAAQLAQQYVKAEGEFKKRDIRAKLSTMLGQQFDAHTKQQQKELEDLEKQISHLRTLIRKRQDARGTIIERRIDQLVLEAEGLGWSAPTTPHAPYFPSISSGKAPQP
jgi:hypothetical protein